jgi:ketosteroid isomerase-like protein
MKYPPVQMALVILVGPVFWACAAATRAAEHPGSVGASNPSSLYKEISKVDSALSTAFNSHDLNALMSLFTGDLEFYHDAGGLQSYTQVRDGFGGLFSKNDGIRREVVAGTLEVYPIRGYGAIEVGAHRFCHDENGRRDCGTFKFLQVWRSEAGKWRITRVISYGH